MTRPLVPPHYINVPVGIVYDKTIPPQVLATYIQIRGTAWGEDETPEISVKKLMELTGKSRSTIYGHLGILRDSGWLLFNSTHHAGLTVRFISDAARDELSKNLDSLNEDGLTDITLTKIIKHPPVNQKNRANTVQKSGHVSKNLDSSNGGHAAPLASLGDAKTAIIDDELSDLLDRLGVYRDKFVDVAAAGWSTGQLKKLALQVLDELGPGNGGGVYLYRLINRKPPESDEDYRRSYVAGDWGMYVEH